MPGPPTLEFWYEFASTYSYLAAFRIEPAADRAGVTVVWRPFLLGPVFRDQGWNDSPFNLFPVKGRYMWRDVERQCEVQGLPFRRPSAFPRSGLLAARVACLAAEEGWCAEFTRQVFRANFAEDLDISDPAVIAERIVRCDQDPERTLERARDPANKQRLRHQTDRAMELGLFGAPSFVVGGELFWGNDRLEQALDWVQRS